MEVCVSPFLRNLDGRLKIVVDRDDVFRCFACRWLNLLSLQQPLCWWLVVDFVATSVCARLVLVRQRAAVVNRESLDESRGLATPTRSDYEP